MLPKAELKAAYDDVVWVWVYRDFKNDERDRAAERVEIRFDVTTYPNLFLVDPVSQQLLSETGREIGPFLAAVKASTSRVKKGKAASGADPDAIAVELEEATAAKKAHPKAATLVGEDDPVVRFRAMQNLAAADPREIVKRAKDLLKVPSDPFRFAVLTTLKEAKDPAAGAAVLAVLQGAGSKEFPSRNVNSLRCHAAEALGEVGDLSAIEALRPCASTGSYLNSLTFCSVNSIASIAGRVGDKARRPAADALIESFPKTDPIGEREAGMRGRLAEAVHKGLGTVLGAGPDFPSEWTEASRAALVKAWQARLGKR